MPVKYIHEFPRQPRDEEDYANLVRSLHYRVGYAYVYGVKQPIGMPYTNDIDAGKLDSLDDNDSYHLVGYISDVLQ